MREDIRNIYLSDPDSYSHLDIDLDNLDDNRKYYVYEWFTVKGNKIFYVGKGTGKRYAHILNEIKEYENDTRKYKGKNYKIISDKYGIDHNIIMDNLTDSEALIMETYYIKKYLNERQPLLNQIIPCVDEETEEYWYRVHYVGDILNYFEELL